MPAGLLLSRVLLCFDTTSEDLYGELSAAALTPDGNLWLGSDELLTVERLTPLQPYTFGEHQSLFLGDFVDLVNHEDEIDIEGMDYNNGYLWLTGSHSTKRKKPKGKDAEDDIERLATVKVDPNRYLIARIPVHGGTLLQSYTAPEHPDQELTAASIARVTTETNETSNILKESLHDDRHLGPFVKIDLPAKENGFDIEGLAVSQNRLLLGLRGPVLRGWAVILEIALEEQTPGVLTMQELTQSGRRYKKHFVDLNGQGIRELCLIGDDLIILAGPTMDLEGVMQVFRLKDAFDLPEESITGQESGRLEVLFDLPFTIGSDHAEGLVRFPGLGNSDALMIVYDSPDPARVLEPGTVYADLFQLPD